MASSKSVVCKVDKRGGIFLPIQLRKDFDISQNARLEFLQQEDGSILLKKLNSTCFFCGASGPLTKMHGISLCRDCCAQAAALDGTEDT